MFKCMIFLIIIGIVSLGGIYVYAYLSDPISLNSANSYYIYDNKDNVIYQGSSNSEWVALNEIDSKLINYIVNTEDQHFYQHFGFDIPRIIKTLFINFKKVK